MAKKQKQKIDWKVISVGLICLTAAELYALSQGIDGTIFTIYVAIVATVLGVILPSPLK
tara:strand:+ start:408 stop:584 length:177 start_codon:yes stop_codon:yes gene_type:complete